MNYNAPETTTPPPDNTRMRPHLRSHPTTSHTHHSTSSTPTPTVYQPRISFTSDSGATDILVTQRDSNVLTHYTLYTTNSNRPGFSIANDTTIYPIAAANFKSLTHPPRSPPMSSTTPTSPKTYSALPRSSTWHTRQPTPARASLSTTQPTTQLSTAQSTPSTTSGNSHYPNRMHTPLA